MFELSQLRCFVAVAEELHFGHAAARLNMTQPPLSRQVRVLEHTLGILLLERTSRSVRLAPAGRAFLAEARRIMVLADGAALAARRVARGELGSIALGCTAAASYSLVPRLLAFTAANLPGIGVVLKEMVTAEQMEALATGRLDLGLVRAPFDPRAVEAACILRERLLLAVPRGHRLATGPEPSVADLDGQPMIMWSPVEGRYFHDLVSGLCAAAGAAPAHVQYITQTHTMLALVGAGLGLALVPEAARSLHFDRVVLRPIRSRRRLRAELHLVWRRDNTNQALAPFRDAVLREFRPPPAD
jgi:DNA-binding transcriptional LysR family regulator